MTQWINFIFNGKVTDYLVKTAKEFNCAFVVHSSAALVT